MSATGAKDYCLLLYLYAGLFDKMADSDLKDGGQSVISGKACYLIAFQSIVSLIQKRPASVGGKSS